MISKDSLILVVDDMTAIRTMIKGFLNTNGFENVVEAADGISGWEMLSDLKTNYSLAIVDWTMPVCSGSDLLKRVKSSQRFGIIPVIILLTKAEQAHAESAIKAGANEVLIKPFSAQDLIQKMNSI